MTAIRRPPPRSLDDVRDPDGDDPFPVHVLPEAGTALVLFAAAWHGRQDAYHAATAGLFGTCVDTDGVLLDEMARVYPAGWAFHEMDVFAYTAQAIANGLAWDIVTLDPFTNLFDRCADLVETWCSLARRAVVLGTGEYTVLIDPPGWRTLERRKRSEFNGGVYWTVLVPC